MAEVPIANNTDYTQAPTYTKIAEVYEDLTFDESRWQTTVLSGENDSTALFWYKKPVKIYGKGVYQFPEGSTGFYSPDGVKRASNIASYKLIYICYMAIGTYTVFRALQNMTNTEKETWIKNRAGIPADTKLWRDILNDGYLRAGGISTQIPGDIPLGGGRSGNKINICSPDFLSEFTPSDEELGINTVTLTLFGDLLNVKNKLPRANNAFSEICIGATRDQTTANWTGIVDMAFIGEEKNGVLGVWAGMYNYRFPNNPVVSVYPFNKLLVHNAMGHGPFSYGNYDQAQLIFTGVEPV